MAFMGTYWEAFCSRLRNAASRREVFRRSDDYHRIFSWGDEQPEDAQFKAGSVHERAMQMLLASKLEAAVRSRIADDKKADRKRRGALRKAAFFIARGVYLKELAAYGALLSSANAATTAGEVQSVAARVDALVEKQFGVVVKVFDKAMTTHVKSSGGDMDAALKNTKFARDFENEVQSITSKT